MSLKIINTDSKIPLFGLDFIGILDRGTNLIEVKPITICNIKCKYCFVHAGDYKNNFFLDNDYIIEWVKKAIQLKKAEDIEIHIAPYGEFFLYKDGIELIKKLKSINEIKVISIQTNGLLLNEELIKNLEDAGLSRLNISFNSLNQEIASYLSGNLNYSVEKMLRVFRNILESKIDLLIAPIWFFGKNDQEIIKIIELVKKFESEGYIGNKLRLGIQNYLVYKTGRKLKKVKERDFSFFYQKLAELEKIYDIKLKLGPNDFNIHKTGQISPPVNMGEQIKIQVISEGRTPKEYIGALNPMWAVKLLSNTPLKIGSIVKAEVIKKKTKENLITAIVNP